MNILKKYGTLMLCGVLTSFIFSQQNLSVPLEDPVYNLLEHAQIRGYCKQLHNSRPYTLSIILDSLNQVLGSTLATPDEKSIVQKTITRLQPKQIDNFNVAKFFKQGFFRYENQNAKVPLTVQAGIYFDSHLNSNFTTPSISGSHWNNLYILGDLSKYFSYGMSTGFGIMKLNFDSYLPNTFTQNWDGYQYYLKKDKLGNFDGLSEKTVGALRFSPELGVSFFDNKLGINFSRVRRDWGTGDGNLMLSKTARPFVALDMFLHPTEWINLSFITGSLEFLNSKHIKTSAETFQNNYTAIMAELFIGKWGYLGFNSSAIWVKRFDMGYLNPLMVPLLYQTMAGDFDNLQFGIMAGINFPKYAKIYYNLFIDEFDPGASHFFHQAGTSMLAWQIGTKVAIPNYKFLLFKLQYTKLEPFMYTHPLHKVPGYAEGMDVNYINHGEPLGYKLEPNSDELKIQANILPFWFLNVNVSYSLVRHGMAYSQDEIDGTNNAKGKAKGKVPGSSYEHTMIYQQGEKNAYPGHYYWKDFLKDGVYEWIHALGVEADLDLRFVKDIPLKLSMGYVLSFTHHTEFIDNQLRPTPRPYYKNKFGNYFKLSIKVY